MKEIVSGLKFPEGPVALPDGSVAFVEIADATVKRVTADGAVQLVAQLSGGPNGLAVGPDGCLYVCNNGGLGWKKHDGLLHPHGVAEDYETGRIERIDPRTGRVERLYDSCAGTPLRAPNDLVFDARGGFYFTDTGRNLLWAREYGRICYAAPDGSGIREIATPMLTPNGIGLSPDGATLYVAETETARLWAFNVVAPGVLAPHAGSRAPHGGNCIGGLTGYHRFDSLAVQADGDICVATLVSGCISVFGANGALKRQVMVPDRSCTNICFGGTDMKTAYITLASTGRLIAMDWDEPGLELNFQRKNPWTA